MTIKCCRCNLEWNVSQIAYKSNSKRYVCPDCERKLLKISNKETFRSVLLSNKKRWGNRIG